jgi:error-prone DNA polymerase
MRYCGSGAFEAHRRVVMTSAMIGVRGTVQREGQVIHVVADRIDDHTPLLRSVGDMSFPHRPGPGDGVTHPGSPDRGEKGWKPKSRTLRAPSIPADVENVLHQKTRDFH